MALLLADRLDQQRSWSWVE